MLFLFFFFISISHSLVELWLNCIANCCFWRRGCSQSSKSLRMRSFSTLVWRFIDLTAIVALAHVVVVVVYRHNHEQHEMQSTWPSNINTIMFCVRSLFYAYNLHGKPSWGLLFHNVNYLWTPFFFRLLDILQVLGTIIFGVGLWLAVDKHSLIALLKLVESERIEVSIHRRFQAKVEGGNTPKRRQRNPNPQSLILLPTFIFNK